MKRIMIIGGTLAALAVPATAAAAPPAGTPPSNSNAGGSSGATPTPPRGPNPAERCRAERTTMTVVNFNNTYGTNANKSNAFGRCVSRYASLGRTHTMNAAQRCRAEQSDANFAAAHGGKSFAEFYGANAEDTNAFGKCVSAKAQAAATAGNTAVLNAARYCRTAQRSAPMTFRNRWGTGPTKSNAFGRCVATTVRA